ncbi:biosynthetic peptidoglycan transglycosylase [Pseudomonas jessenii]|uniref:biosynthetic peptidoglycan transglycosylase n=1 Tax=Pseudomonas jessenii TaxID=77298 RepID=UPI003891668D
MKCSTIVKEIQSKRVDEVTDSLIRALVVGEDHRNALHFGVDPIAILRSIKVRVFEGKRQGASTIEQQLVRTVTGRYEKTPRRKIREQILAVMLNSKFEKDDLACCYLTVAYYGASLVGVSGLRKLSSSNPHFTDEVIVAHLKYPRTSNPDGVVAKKHLSRVNHIRRLLEAKSTGLFLQRSSRAFPESP